MKVYVSQAYLDWIDSRRSDKKAIKAFDRFLESIHNAKSVAEAPKPRNRESCTTKSGIDGTVIAYEVARTYRLYADWITPFDGANVAFYAAVAMSKSNEKSQGDDIGKAITMFKCFDSVKWILWEPSAQQPDTPVEFKSDEVINVSDNPVKDSKPKKQKGKPVDENGLTVAERKAIRKKEQEEKQKQQQLEAEQKRLAKIAKAEQNKTQENISEKVTADEVKEMPSAAVVDNAPVAVDAPQVKTDVADTAAPRADAPAKPTVTLNGVPVAEPLHVKDDAKFQDVMDVQYELEMIEHQVRIRALEIEIAKHKIALEELAIKKLELLQIQKMKDLQK